MSKDYYQILGVEKSASEADVKKAYRRLAHEHHPDKQGGDEQKFKDLNEAYHVLGDKDRRAKYDQFGSAAFEQGGMGGPSGFGGFDFSQGFNMNMDDLGDLSDVLGGMFGFGGRSRGPKRGRDLELELDLEFNEAAFGADKEVTIYTNNSCQACKGAGADADAKVTNCSTCGGTGRVQQTQRTLLGVFNTVAVCSACQGKGQRPDKLCGACGGTGIEKREKKLTVKVPAGMRNGEALKVTGEGDYPGAGGRAGDLYIRVHVRAHKEFSREDHNVLSTVYVPFTLMSLGGKVDINTVDGPVVLKIPSGSSAGASFKLRGKGIPYLSGYGRGDHLVTIYPEVPQKLTREQKKLLEDLKEQGL